MEREIAGARFVTMTRAFSFAEEDILDTAVREGAGKSSWLPVLRRRDGRVREKISEGDASRDARDWGAAVSAYTAALLSDREQPGVWKQLGHALKERGDRALAEKAYACAAQQSPRDADAHLHLGHVRRLCGNRSGAFASLLTAVSIDPANASAQAELQALSAAILEGGFVWDEAVSHDAGDGWREAVRRLEDAWRHHLPGFLNAAASVAAQSRTIAANDGRLTEVERKLAAATGALDAMRGRVEAADALIRGQAAMGAAEATARAAAERAELAATALAMRADQEFARIWDRLEFARREMMFELRHSVAAVATTTTTPQIVAEDKLAAMRAGDVRLNLGCGHIPLDGYLNVDRRALPGVDIVAEADDLPFEAGDVSEITSAHLLEHFPQEALRRRLLPYWMRLLAPGGVLTATAPDGDAMLSAIARGEYAFEEFREVLFGAQDYHDDFHYNLFTPESLAALVAEAGFKDIAIPVRGRRNGKCFEFTLCAVRP